jgi:hypothetical protein
MAPLETAGKGRLRRASDASISGRTREGGAMRKLSISQAWDETRAILARDGRLFVSVALALIVLPQTILGVVGLPQQSEGGILSRVLFLLALLIGFTAQLALNRLAMSPPITVGAAISRGFKRLLSLVPALLLVGTLLLIVIALIATVLLAMGSIQMPVANQPPTPGLLAMIAIPAVLISAIFQLCVPVAAKEDGGPIHLVRRSWSLGVRNYWRLLAFVVLILLAAGIAVLVGQIVVGSLVVLALGKPDAGSLAALIYALLVALIQSAFTVVGSVMLARIYLQLASASESGAGVPISGT